MRAHIDGPGRRVLELGLADTGAADAAFVRDGVLTVRLAGAETALVRVDELGIAGAHNVLNASPPPRPRSFWGRTPPRSPRAS